VELDVVDRPLPQALAAGASVYACRKQPDRAFVWLDRAYRQRDSGLAWTKADPCFKNLAPDPRWKALLRKFKPE